MKRKIALFFLWLIFVLISTDAIGTSIRRNRIRPQAPYSIYTDKYVMERERSFFYYIWEEMSVKIEKEKKSENEKK